MGWFVAGTPTLRMGWFVAGTPTLRMGWLVGGTPTLRTGGVFVGGTPTLRMRGVGSLVGKWILVIFIQQAAQWGVDGYWDVRVQLICSNLA